MVILYTPQISNRLQYITTQLFNRILGVECCLTSDLAVFKSSPYAQINYSSDSRHGGIWIKPHGLLNATGIDLPTDFSTGVWGQLPTLFSNLGFDIPFDIFAASFYLITRYEEYNPSTLDVHKRYQATESWAFKAGVIEEPLIDLWIFELKKRILEHDPNTQFVPPVFSYTSTIDLDQIYLYKNRGAVLTTIALLKSLLKRDFKSVKERLLVSIGVKEDPYFNVKEICARYENHQIKALFFVLWADFGTFDRRYLYPSRQYRRLLVDLHLRYQIGTHPSYKASFSTIQTQKEKRKLEKVIGAPLTVNRQHFLRFNMPETYSLLTRLGITDDYTMVYASHVGFRASTSIPFPFYNLQNEQEYPLLIHPTMAMDVTLNQYMKLTANESYEKIIELLEKTKLVNGSFVTLFHNSSFDEKDQWRGWTNVFEELLHYAQKSQDQSIKQT